MLARGERFGTFTLRFTFLMAITAFPGEGAE